MTEQPIQGTIELANPLRGLGTVTDIHGERWDIHGIIGSYVQACPVSQLHAYYTDTSSGTVHGLVQQTWKPYNIKIVKDANEK
jgi:hypothetical protein